MKAENNKILIIKVAVDTPVFAADKLYDYKCGVAILPGQRVLVPFGRGNRLTEAMVLAVTEHTDQEKLKSVEQVLDAAPVIDENGLKLALWMNDRFFCTVYEALHAMLPIGLWHRQSDVVEPALNSDAAWALVGLNSELAHGLEILSKGAVPLSDWQSALGIKWQTTLHALGELGLARRVIHVKKRLKGKTERVARLTMSSEEAHTALESLKRTAKTRKAVLSLLMSVESVPVREISQLTGASSKSIAKFEKDGMITVFERELPPDYEDAPPAAPANIRLNEEQENAYIGIHSLLDTRHPVCALLYGVTGSGKTSVYIKLLQDVVDDGGRAILLVPEISLTPQLISALSGYFSGRIAVLHSALGIGERVEAWRAIKDGRVDIVVGTRSAVFAPLPSLRMIIIDEEQEHTYKSENAPRYNARDVAKFRCVQHRALLLLGSATPSLESSFSAQKGAYALFKLSSRYNESALPPVIMADMRNELRNGNDTTISSILRDEIQTNLSSGEQTILFLNRRGYHRLITCPECGSVRQCPCCSVSLTYHSHNNRLMCHYCGHSEPMEKTCDSCGGELRFLGAGTQKVASDLEALFPGAETLRMDTDTTSYKGAHETLLKSFVEKQIPILIGTQMVTKGLDFGNVTLVGIISADLSLYVDDFRANERTFNLITQVIGRAGRGDKPGRAVIQTFSPSHPVLLQAAAQDYHSFYESEIALREQQGYPPFSDMIMLNCFGSDQDVLLRACLRLRGQLDRGVGELGLRIRVVGPAPASVYKVNNRFRYHITLYGSQDIKTRRFISTLLRRFPKDSANKGVVVYADLHPNGF